MLACSQMNQWVQIWHGCGLRIDVLVVKWAPRCAGSDVLIQSTSEQGHRLSITNRYGIVNIGSNCVPVFSWKRCSLMDSSAVLIGKRAPARPENNAQNLWLWKPSLMEESLRKHVEMWTSALPSNTEIQGVWMVPLALHSASSWPTTSKLAW